MFKLPSINKKKDILVPTLLGASLLLCLMYIFQAIITESISNLWIVVIASILGILSYGVSKSKIIFTPLLLLIATPSLQLTEGFSANEIIFTLCYYIYLVLFVVSRNSNVQFIIRNKLDIYYTSFILLLAFATIRSLLFNLDWYRWGSEGLALSVFLAYYPIRDYCIKYKNGIKLIIGIMLCWSIYYAAIGIFEYQYKLSNAEYAWQIYKARVAGRELQLLYGVLFFIYLFFQTNQKFLKIAFASLFGIMFAALLIAQSRATWVCFALSMVLIYFKLKKNQRVHFMIMFSVILSIATAIGYYYMGEAFWGIGDTILERINSLKTATRIDISLINRFQEVSAVSTHIFKNPLLGYGLGVNYEVFDLTIMGTMHKNYVHNGYISLIYKYGILGMLLTIFVWLYFTGKSFYAMIFSHNKTHKIVSFLLFVLLLNMLILNSIGYLFSALEHIFVFTCSFAMISAINLLDKQENAI